MLFFFFTFLWLVFVFVYFISCIILFLAFALAHSHCCACRSAALMKTLKRFVFSVRCSFFFLLLLLLALPLFLLFNVLVKNWSSTSSNQNDAAIKQNGANNRIWKTVFECLVFFYPFSSKRLTLFSSIALIYSFERMFVWPGKHTQTHMHMHTQTRANIVASQTNINKSRNKLRFLIDISLFLIRFR